jgi:WhiB family redox-sensing transcriptional regulator
MQFKGTSVPADRPVTDWRPRSACLQVDPGLFFGPDGERAPTRRAREGRAAAVCGVCPVVAECTTWSLNTANPYGVWGGIGEDERAEILAAPPASLLGCQSFAIAEYRASTIITPGSLAQERWNAPARRILAVLLHAAALANRSIHDVLRWIEDSTPATKAEVMGALQATPSVDACQVTTARTFWEIHPRTRLSLATTIAQPLQSWLSHDVVEVAS